MINKILYHASIHEFDEIDLSKCKGYRDFGPGFYTTGFMKHAVKCARRMKQREAEKLKLLGLEPEKIKIFVYCRFSN